MPSKLYLVGAGPGDPGLLTVKGKRCLEQADVVIYDYLANPRLLDYARPDTVRLLAGKHGGGVRVEQEVINRMIVEHARQDKIVVRLKGGDPFLFGRGGEEAEAAAAAGIDFEIVPGVSSVSAVPAYAGIPLTHRHLASNVIVTTGYEQPAKTESVVHWHELARTSGSTLVVLMTQRQLHANMEKLIAGGMAPDTPAAVIQWGTRAAQRTVVGTVATIARRCAARDIRPPAIAVVGAVVTLRETLNWFEHKPLFGRRIVVTRPRHQAANFAERLEALGAEVVPFPTIETVPPESFAPLDAVLQRPGDFDWVIFTSANGVRAFFDRLKALAGDIRDWHAARLAAIGPQTASALTAYGVRVATIAEEFRAEGMVAALAAAGVAGTRVLLPRAAGARTLLPEQLRGLGAAVEEVTTYTTRAPRAQAEELRQLLLRGEIDLVTFTSSSTVHHFVAAFEGCLDAVLAHAAVGCIGPVTAETARNHGLQVRIQPDSYTIPALVEAIARYYSKAPAAPRDLGDHGC